MAKNDDNDEVVKIGTAIALIAICYFGVVKPIMNSLGVNDQDGADIADVENSANADNPFSIYFGTEYNAAHEKNPGIAKLISFNDFKPDDFATGFDMVTNLNYTMDPASLLVISIAENLYNAFGIFTVDLDAINAAISSFSSQYDVSRAAQYLNYVYGKDLYVLLKNGRGLMPFFGTAITANQLATIVRHVKSLPVWPIAWSY